MSWYNPPDSLSFSTLLWLAQQDQADAYDRKHFINMANIAENRQKRNLEEQKQKLEKLKPGIKHTYRGTTFIEWVTNLNVPVRKNHSENCHGNCCHLMYCVGCDSYIPYCHLHPGCSLCNDCCSSLEDNACVALSKEWHCSSDKIGKLRNFLTSIRKILRFFF